MLKTSHVLIASLVISSIQMSSVRADYCSAVNLGDEGGSMEHVKVRDQNFGDCYAQATSEFADAVRFTHEDGDKDYNVQTSAFTLAVQFKSKQLPFLRDIMGETKYMQENGNFCGSLAAVQKNGGCSRDAVRIGTKKAGYEVSKKFLGQLQAIIAGSQKTEEEREANLKKIVDLVTKQNPERAAKLDLGALKKYLKKSDEYSIAKEVISGVCKEEENVRKIPGKFTCENMIDLGQATHESFKSYIHKKLDEGKKTLPIPFAYCAEVIYQGSAYEKPGLMKMVNAVIKKDGKLAECGFHLGLIVGRVYDVPSNSCKLIVRNSWGKTFSTKSQEVFGDSKGNFSTNEDLLIDSMVALEAISEVKSDKKEDLYSF